MPHIQIDPFATDYDLWIDLVMPFHMTLPATPGVLHIASAPKYFYYKGLVAVHSLTGFEQPHDVDDLTEDEVSGDVTIVHVTLPAGPLYKQALQQLIGDELTRQLELITVHLPDHSTPLKSPSEEAALMQQWHELTHPHISTSVLLHIEAELTDDVRQQSME